MITYLRLISYRRHRHSSPVSAPLPVSAPSVGTGALHRYRYSPPVSAPSADISALPRYQRPTQVSALPSPVTAPSAGIGALHRCRRIPPEICALHRVSAPSTGICASPPVFVLSTGIGALPRIYQRNGYVRFPYAIFVVYVIDIDLPDNAHPCRRVRKLPSAASELCLVLASVRIRLDYCNSVHHALPWSRLQLLQSASWIRQRDWFVA